MSDFKLPGKPETVEETKSVVEPPKQELASVKGMQISLLEDAAIITLPNGTSKTISLSDFHNLISTSYGRMSEEVGSEILLPRNCIYLSTSPRSVLLTLYYPETIQSLTYCGNGSGGKTEAYRVPTPNIVICISLEVKAKLLRVTNSQYFCTDRPVGAFNFKHGTSVNRNVGLYLLPFSNIYETGKLCTGGNAMPSEVERTDMRKLNWYHDVLFNSPFNDDLGLYALGDWGNNVRAWYQFLQAEAGAGRKFPYSKLRNYTPASV